MVIFLKKSAIFLGILSAFSILVMLTNQHFTNRFLKKNYSNINTLFLGDSHTEWLNETVIDRSCNLFQGGDTYKAAYFKLLKMHELNPKLENLIVTFGYHNLSQLYEKRINLEVESIKRTYQLTSPVEAAISTEDYRDFFGILSRYIITPNLSIYYHDERTRLHFDEIIKYDSFEKLEKKHFQELEKGKDYLSKKLSDSTANEKASTGGIWWHFTQWKKQTDKHSINYLGKILAFANANDIEVFLLHTPVDPDYLSKIPTEYKERFDFVADSLAQKHDFKLLDYSRLFANRLELLQNPDHISKYGGAVLTRKIDSLIQKTE